MSYKVYSKKRPISYTWGAFPTFELIKYHPEWIEQILIHSTTDQSIQAELMSRMDPRKIRQDDQLIEKLADKENVYVLGVFRPNWPSVNDEHHIVLDEPSNFGNLGTIIRTALGLGFTNIVLIGHACDHQHPLVIRASMGAIFSVNIEKFASFDDYLKAFPNHHCYAFMGESSTEINQLPDVSSPVSLIFGNESRGLDQTVSTFAKPISIAMSDQVDSFNITIAAGIGLYHFSQQLKLIKK